MGNTFSCKCYNKEENIGENVAPFVEDTFALSSGVKTVSFSPKNPSILCYGGDDKKLILTNMQEKTKKELTGHDGTISGSDFSKDGSILATSSWDETCRIWQVEGSTDDESVELKGHSLSVYCVKFFHKDPTKLMSGSYDGTVRIWDIEKQKNISKLKSVEGYVECIDILLDDNTIISGANEKMRIWDLKSGKCVHILADQHRDTVHSVKFDLDTFSIASASQTVKITDLRTLEILQSFEEHSGPIQDVCFNPFGKYLLSASWDRTIKLYDIPGEKVLYSLSDHTDRVNCVQFSPEGKHFASGSDDRNVHFWSCDIDF